VLDEFGAKLTTGKSIEGPRLEIFSTISRLTTGKSIRGVWLGCFPVPSRLHPGDIRITSGWHPDSIRLLNGRFTSGLHPGYIRVTSGLHPGPFSGLLGNLCVWLGRFSGTSRLPPGYIQVPFAVDVPQPTLVLQLTETSIQLTGLIFSQPHKSLVDWTVVSVRKLNLELPSWFFSQQHCFVKITRGFSPLQFIMGN